MSTFVLIHGVPGCAASWNKVSAYLTDHRTLIPSLLGFGDGRAADIPDELLAPAQARHVLAAMDEAEIDRAVVVGHDFGGPVAAHMADIAPGRIEALALLSTNAFPDTPIPFPLSTLNLPVLGRLADRILFSRPSLRMMLRQGVGTPGVTLDAGAYIGNRTQHAAIATIFGNSLRRLRELYSPVEAALRSVAVPVFVGWGDHDPFFPVDVGRRTADLFADARFRLYEGAGHFLPEERPQELAADLIALSQLVSQP